MKSKRRNKRSFIAWLLILVMIISFMPVFPAKVHAAATLNTNLINAGDAEISGAGMETRGWAGDNVNSFYAYGASEGVTPHGGSYFAGFYSNMGFTYTKTAWLDIDVSALSTDINAGNIISNFNGWMIRSGVTSGDAVIQVQQLDQYGSVLGVESNSRYGSTPSGWKNVVFTEAVLPNTVKIRVKVTGENYCNGYAAFDDLSLKLTGNVTAAPTITSVASQEIVSGASTGPLAIDVDDADTAVGSLTLVGTSSNTTLIPDANITFGGSGANRTVNVTAQTAQTGTATITVAVSDGTKKGYTSFLVTVSPNAQINSELVVNGGGNTISGWQGDTSRYQLGSAFVVGSVNGTTADIYQDMNIGKFSTLINTGLLRYNASAVATGTGAFFRFEGYDQWNTLIWTVNSNQTNTLLPAQTRLVRVVIGGKVGASIKNVSFKIPNTNLPAMTTIADQQISAGGTATSSCTIAYEGNSISLTAESSNTAVIPNGNITISGTGYQRTIKAVALTGTNGVAQITIKSGSTAIGSYNVTVKDVPGAPTAVSAVPGDGTATVSFTAPVNNGGSSITNYEVTASPGNIKATGTGSPITVSGLTNGTSYTFTVRAQNSTGYSASSSASDSILLQSVPKEPTGVVGTPGDGSVTVSFTPPSSNGGAEITEYTVTSSPEGKTITGTGSPLTITGLTNGTAYTFTVTATNAKGTGAASTASSSVTPRTIPGTPGNVQAQWGNGSASITFDPPTSDGGNSIKQYIVTAMPGNITATGTTSPITVNGLTNGSLYTFSVKAKNDAGEGAASDGSASTTPKTVPGKPAGVTAVAGNKSAIISFTQPTEDGGSAITGYEVTVAPGGATVTGATSPITVSGLTNGTTYTFTVKAINSAGGSLSSDASASIIPKTIPGKPTNVVATPGNGFATITFDSPTDNGGATITSYTVISTPGNITAVGTGNSIVVSGLTNGEHYTFEVKATNSVGDSDLSTSSSSVMPDTPNYVILYDMNGGTGIVPTETTKKENVIFKTKTCTTTPPTGMQFKEWNIKADGTGTGYKAGDEVTVGTADITLYAIWEIIPEVVSVEVTPTDTILDKGGTLQLTKKIVLKGTASGSLTWTSSDASGKVTVSSTGMVTVAADAVADAYTITATSDFDHGKKAQVIIRVAPDLAPFENTKKAVKQTDYFSDSWAAYQVVVTNNTVTRASTQTEVDQAIKAIGDAQKTLVERPKAKDITTSNVLIIGEYAFVLGNDSYSEINFNVALGTKYVNPSTSKTEIYYFAGGKWYDLTKNDGKGLLEPIDPLLINGDGRYTYWNMVEKRP